MSNVIYIKTTDTCNLDCSHCYSRGSLGNKTYWNIDNVISFLKDYFTRNKKEVHLELHGGEPFLCKVEDLMRFGEFTEAIKQDYPNTTLGITSNLVFNLTDRRLAFLKRYIDGLGTSYDATGRFLIPNHYDLWKRNLRALQSYLEGIDIVVNISLSKAIINKSIEDLFENVILKNNINIIRFEKITLSGNAIVNRDVIPSNLEANDYLLQLHEYLEKNDLREKVSIINLEEIYSKFEKGITREGTYFRECERSIFTLNADGTVSGCPNDAEVIHYGNISESLDKIENSERRIIQIHSEMQLKDPCYTCQYLEICGGGCYKLHWDETGCPSPKKLFKLLQKR